MRAYARATCLSNIYSSSYKPSDLSLCISPCIYHSIDATQTHRRIERADIVTGPRARAKEKIFGCSHQSTWSSWVFAHKISRARRMLSIDSEHDAGTVWIWIGHELGMIIWEGRDLIMTRAWCGCDLDMIWLGFGHYLGGVSIQLTRCTH